MRIYFSPYYDGHAWKDMTDSTVLWNTAVVGTCGLLEQLELRAGLTAVIPPSYQRENKYKEAVGKHVAGSVFESSFNLDESGVTAKLLEWRDALVMTGWTGNEATTSNKLQLLAAIEKDFDKANYPGESDRWVKIAAQIDRYDWSRIEDIEVNCNEKELSPLVWKVLQSLQMKGVNVHYTQQEDEILHADNIEVIEFKEQRDAYAWLAVNEEAAPDLLIVNRDNHRLNGALRVNARPLVTGYTEDSNPAILQTFKLGLSLFSRHLNVENLLSYLQLPESPVPYAKKLADALLWQGGIGEDWNKVIEEYLQDAADKTERRKRESRLEAIAMVKNDYSDGNIAVEDLYTYLCRLEQWALGKLAMEETSNIHRDEVRTLAGYCREMRSHLPQEGTVSEQWLRTKVDHVYKPVSLEIGHDQVGAFQVVRQLRDVVDCPHRLIWLDSAGSDNYAFTYDFLSRKEMQELNSALGEVITCKEELLSIVHRRRNYLLNHISKVTIVTARYDNNQPLAECGVLDEVRKRKNVQAFAEGNVGGEHEQKEVRGFTSKAYYKIDPELAKKMPFHHMTATSFPKLIQTPFDYLIERAAMMKEPETEQISNIYIVKGNVAHYFIEMLFKKAQGNRKKMLKLFENDFGTLFEEAISTRGLMLLQPKNQASLESFRRELKKTVKTLLDIIDKNNWNPYASEMEITLDEFGAYGQSIAKIDFVLTDQKGDYVILDFKWSKNKDYPNMLKKNQSIQLEFYRTILECTKDENGIQRHVSTIGYYLFPLCQLFTLSELMPANGVVTLENEGDPEALTAEMQNGFDYRMKELREGIVEEAEGMPVEKTDDCPGINYYMDTEHEDEELNLFPLGTTQAKKGAPVLKKEGRYNKILKDKLR